MLRSSYDIAAILPLETAQHKGRKGLKEQVYSECQGFWSMMSCLQLIGSNSMIFKLFKL